MHTRDGRLFTIICKECNRLVANSNNVLGRHLRKAHGIEYPDYVVKHEYKNQWPTCICGCCVKLQWKKGGFGQFASKSCASAGQYNFMAGKKGLLSPNFGKIRTEAHRKKYSHAAKKRWNDPIDRGHRLRIMRSNDYREKMRKHALNLLDKNKWGPQAPHKTEWVLNTQSGVRELMHSSWESMFFKRMLEHETAKLTKKHNIQIPYNDNKCINHRYIPDFLIDNTLIVEIKGWDDKHEIKKTATHEWLKINDNYEYVDICATNKNDFYEKMNHFIGAYSLLILPDGTRRTTSFKFKDEKHPIITREQLIRINEPQFAGPGRKYTEDVILPFLMKFFREYAHMHGWFYPQPQSVSDAIEEVRKSLIKNDLTSTISSTHGSGTKYLKSLFKSYWHVDNGPVSAFWNDNKFEKVLRYRLGLNDSKAYEYTLSDGTEVSCRETFDINIKNVRFGLIVQRNSVSFFKPHAAARIYSRYLEGVDSPTVWDPSSGFGARLLGFASMFPCGRYIGTEPAKMTFADLATMSTDLVASSTLTPAVELHMVGSEMFTPAPSSLDMVFTSPPYFEKEKYFNEPGQCWLDYPSERAWYDGYLVPTFRNAHTGLKPDAKMVINIDDKHRSLVERAAAEVGFRLVAEDTLLTGRDHFNRKHGHTDSRTEPILAFARDAAS